MYRDSKEKRLRKNPCLRQMEIKMRMEDPRLKEETEEEPMLEEGENGAEKIHALS